MEKAAVINHIIMMEHHYMMHSRKKPQKTANPGFLKMQVMIL